MISIFIHNIYFSSDDMQNTSLNTRIEALELNLKKIQDELIMEKNRLGGDTTVEHLSTVKDYINNESEEKAIDTHIDTNDELASKYRSNPVRR